MNIFAIYLNKIKKILKEQSIKGMIKIPNSLQGINVNIPPDHYDCDVSTNAAMVLSKVNNMSPVDLAEKIIPLLKSKDSNIDTIDIVKPGFINIKFNHNFWNKFLKKIISEQTLFGSSKEKKQKYLIEFVSANPTGPLHVGHCRGAILGDVISNILKFNNQKVIKEYYVNDHGSQIHNFTLSVYFRAREIIYKEDFPYENSDLYPGDYIKLIAKNIINKYKNTDFTNFEKISKKLTKYSIDQSLQLVKSNLNDLGIKHDNFIKESDLINNKEVKKVVNKLIKKNFIYEGKIQAPISEQNNKWIERNQMLFKSSNFGDDKDRPLQKEDMSWTYFAGDVAYHNNKLNRKFDILINILGADHAGYVKRITAVVEAISGKKNILKCKVSRLVKLIKDVKPFKMSKRKGDYITVEDLVKEVGKDATRFIMLNRSSDVDLDFDFTKVKEKSKENPLYYVQYCYARITSVFRHVKFKMTDKIKVKNYNFKYSPQEIKILRKISQWPLCIETSLKKLEPHRIPTYLYELASEFHSYWNLGRDNEEFRFIDKNKKITDDKIVFLKVISNVIKSGMNIVNVSTPEKM